jgi:hypothetical protein
MPIEKTLRYPFNKYQTSILRHKKSDIPAKAVSLF